MVGEELYENVCSIENLELAFEKATRGKSGKIYVIDFNKDLKKNLELLRQEFKTQIKPTKNTPQNSTKKPNNTENNSLNQITNKI